MTLTLDQAVGQKLLLGFQGTQPPAELLDTLKQRHLGGVTLFRTMNLNDVAQIRELTDAVQRAARDAGQPPLIVGVDQEGGTLMAVPGATRFPGNLALGATRSPELARRAGYAMGRELAALGFNLNYAPVCDVIHNAQNPVVGPRSFGADPQLVAPLASAMIDGLQAAGVAAAAKHFPGHGASTADSHQGLDVLPHDAARLREIELVPFEAAIRSGVKLMMTAHIALPRFDDGFKRPATLSPRILRQLLRDELQFGGVTVSDAFDMQAIRQGMLNPLEAVIGAAAGLDLLLLTAFVDQPAIYEALRHAAQRGLLDQADLLASAQRVLDLKQWISQQTPPSLEVVGCAEHAALAREIAARSITLVRDEAHWLPLKLSAEDKLVVVVPQPKDLTPADTSSYDRPALAEPIRVYHANTAEVIIPFDPDEADVAALADQVAQASPACVIVGTINAYEHVGQAALINTLIERGAAVIAIALRMPYDLRAYPRASAYLCTYSLQPASLQAAAQVLWGQLTCQGQLPVTVL